MDGCLSSLPPSPSPSLLPFAPASSAPLPLLLPAVLFCWPRSLCLHPILVSFRFLLPSVSHDNHPSTLWPLRIQPSVIRQPHYLRLRLRLTDALVYNWHGLIRCAPLDCYYRRSCCRRSSVIVDDQRALLCEVVGFRGSDPLGPTPTAPVRSGVLLSCRIRCSSL